MRYVHLLLAVVVPLAGYPEAARSETRDLILVAGQSNAVGFDAYASELAAEERDKSVLFWWRVGDPPPDRYDVTSDGRWSQLQTQSRGTPMDPKSVNAEPKLLRQYGNFKKPEGGFGPEIGLCRTLLSQEARPLAIVKVAFSGTSLYQDWNPDGAGDAGICYRSLISETQLAVVAGREKGIDFKLRALIWVQGESDATQQYASQYEKNLERMLVKLRADLGAPELIALIGVNTRFGNLKNPQMPTIIAAQRAVAERVAYTVYVDTEGAETLAPSHTHFTANGTLDIGGRFAKALHSFDRPSN